MIYSEIPFSSDRSAQPPLWLTHALILAICFLWSLFYFCVTNPGVISKSSTFKFKVLLLCWLSFVLWRTPTTPAVPYCAEAWMYLHRTLAGLHPRCENGYLLYIHHHTSLYVIVKHSLVVVNGCSTMQNNTENASLYRLCGYWVVLFVERRRCC